MNRRLEATLALEEPVSRLSGVSSVRTKALSKLGVKTIRDLLAHYPRRYLDMSKMRTCASAQIGESCTIIGKIHEVKLKRPRYNLAIVEVSIVDKTGIIIVSFFHQPWLKDKLKTGTLVMIAGKAEFSYGFLRMNNPILEELEEVPAHGRVIPVHPATEKLGAAAMRKLIAEAIALTEGAYDPIPLSFREKHGLMGRHDAVRAIHFPRSMEEMASAKERLIYEELLMLQLFMLKEGERRARHADATAHSLDGMRLAALDAALPYELTSDQQSAREDVLAAMAEPRVANVMVLGDVGTGKTIVAAFATCAAADSGGQAIIMAPTEVLAQQHYHTLGPLFEKAGVSSVLLTGSTSADDRDFIVGAFGSGAIDVLIGTHAVLEDDVVARNCTLVVIDEQQRFGVEQRAKALAKGAAPDALYLTATPIPRTLALALFGDLRLSYITEKPHSQAGRVTRVLASQQKGEAYDAAKAALARGEQVYVVCPLIGLDTAQRDERSASKRSSEEDEQFHPLVAIEDDSDFMSDNLVAAEQEAEFLQEKVFVDYKVGLLHGSLPSKEKSRVMEEFKSGQIDVLVSTTVIEVGIDVPNATTMIIEDADRFGLSQLHQLRGRVGRGQKPGEVFLISASKSKDALNRLSALVSSDDGFELAKHDLALRREGDILGNRQSGASALKLVNVVRDGGVIEMAHEDAKLIIGQDSELSFTQNRALSREIGIIFKDEKKGRA